MNKKLLKVLFVLSVLAILFTMFTFVNATTIDETTKTNDGKDTIAEKTIVIGVTKFTPGTSITAAKAAKAGANDYKIYIAQNKDPEKYTDPAIYYYVGEDIWFTIDEDGEAEPIDAIQTLDIYYVDNEPKKEVSIPVAQEQGIYTVSFMNDSAVFDAQQIKEGNKATAPKTNPTKTGYTFKGWFLEDKAFDFTATINKDTVLVANWEINKFAVKFVNDDGTELQSVDVAYGTVPVYTGATPTKAADAQYTYTFAGWTPALTAVTGDATYTATYTAEKNKYTITFLDDDGETVLSKSEVEYGTVPTCVDPSKAATAQFTYTFVGWDTEVAPVTGDATYKATYNTEVRKYRVRYIIDGVEDKSLEQEVEYGSTITLRDGATKTGYTFQGWSNVPATMPAEDVFAVATFKINKYTLTLDLDNGAENIKITEDYGTTIEKPADPTKTGYTFAGWNATIPETMPAENLFVRAVYLKNPEVTFTMPEEFIVGEPAVFTVSTVANDFADVMVVGTGSISPDNVTKLEYKYGDTWVEMTGESKFGAAEGFKLSDATSTFRATFGTAGDCAVTFAIKNVETGEIMADVKTKAHVVEKYQKVANAQELIDALKDESIKTIILKNNIAIDTTELDWEDISIKKSIEVTRPVTIDGAGYTLSFTNNPTKFVSNGNNYVMKVYNTTGVTIKDIAFKNSLGGLLVSSSNVTLEGQINVTGNTWGGIEVSKGSTLDTLSKLIVDENAKIVIDDEASNKPAMWICGNEGAIEGGNFTKGYITEKNQTFYYVNKTVATNLVTKIGDMAYDNLYTAVKTIPTNGEEVIIKLLRDVPEGVGFKAEKGQNFVIDLDGHTYTGLSDPVGSPGTETQLCQFLKGSKVTIKNGTLTASNYKFLFLIQNYSDLTLENVTINGNKDFVQYAISNNFGSLTLKGDTKIYTYNNTGVAFDLWYGMSDVYDEGITVIFDESFTGTVDGKIEYGAAGRAVNTEGWTKLTKLEIKNGTFTNFAIVDSSGIVIKNKNIVITGGTFDSDPSAYVPTTHEAVNQGNGTWKVVAKS